jgi:hypothetical protein
VGIVRLLSLLGVLLSVVRTSRERSSGGLSSVDSSGRDGVLVLVLIVVLALVGEEVCAERGAEVLCQLPHFGRTRKEVGEGKGKGAWGERLTWALLLLRGSLGSVTTDGTLAKRLVVRHLYTPDNKSKERVQGKMERRQRGRAR